MSDLLGKTVRDTVNGMTGIAASYCTILGSAPQYGVEPPAVENKAGEAFNIDLGRIVHIMDGPTVDPEEIDDTVIIELGDKVECIVTGFTGIVTTLTTFLNGCVYATATDKGKDGLLGDPKRLFTTHNRFKIIEKGAFKRLWKDAHDKKEAVAAAPAVARGGPRTAVMQRS